MKLRNIFLCIISLLIIFGGVVFCYGDVWIRPPQMLFMEFICEELGISEEEYKGQIMKEYNITEEEFDAYMAYVNYDCNAYYIMGDGMDVFLSSKGFTYQDYLEHKNRDVRESTIGLIGVIVFLCFWVIIFVIIIKKLRSIKNRTIVENVDLVD